MTFISVRNALLYSGKATSMVCSLVFEVWNWTGYNNQIEKSLQAQKGVVNYSFYSLAITSQ